MLRGHHDQQPPAGPPFPSDLSDARWALFEPALTTWRRARTDAGVGGRPAEHDLRDILDAIFYVNRTGIPWRYMPLDFPPWESVYSYFRAWSDEGVFTALDIELTGLARAAAGRKPTPTAAGPRARQRPGLGRVPAPAGPSDPCL